MHYVRIDGFYLGIGVRAPTSRSIIGQKYASRAHVDIVVASRFLEKLDPSVEEECRQTVAEDLRSGIIFQSCPCSIAYLISFKTKGSNGKDLPASAEFRQPAALPKRNEDQASGESSALPSEQ